MLNQTNQNDFNKIFHETNNIIGKAINSVESLRSSIFHLLEQRSFYLIHLTQFEQDYRKLHDIYTKFHQNIIFSQPEQQKSIEINVNPTPIPTKPPPPPQKVDPILTPTIVENNIKQINSRDISWNILPKTSEKYGIKLRFALNISTIVTSIKFDPTGDKIAFVDSQMLQVIDSQTGNIIFSSDIPHLTGFCDVHTRVLCFSPNGNLIATNIAGSGIAIFSVERKSLIKTLEGHTGTVSSLLFLSDSKTLISGGYDGLICIWDIQTMTLNKRISHGQNNSETHQNKDGAIVSLMISKGEEFIGVGFMNGSIGIYEPSFAESMNIFSAHSEFLLSVSHVPIEGAIASTSQDKTIKLWSLLGPAKCRKTFNGHTDFVLCSSFSPISPLLLTGSKDESIRGWNYNTGEELFCLKAHLNTIFGIDHHPNKKVFSSCAGDGLVCVWDYLEP